MTDLIPGSDLEIKIWPPRSIGGQLVGGGSRGVCIVHRPTGITVVVDHERSQHRNRRIAMAAIEGALTCGEFCP